MARPRDEAKAAEARRLHGLDLTTQAIAVQLHVNRRTVQRWTADLARPPGARKRPDVPDPLVQELREQDQATYREIAARTGMSETGVRNRYWSITGRPRAERGGGQAQ